MPWRITRNHTAGLLIVTGGMIVAVAEWRRRQRRKAEEQLRRLPPFDRVFHASETWLPDEIEWASFRHADGTEASEVDDVFQEFADEDLVAVYERRNIE